MNVDPLSIIILVFMLVVFVAIWSYRARQQKLRGAVLIPLVRQDLEESELMRLSATDLDLTAFRILMSYLQEDGLVVKKHDLATGITSYALTGKGELVAWRLKTDQPF